MPRWRSSSEVGANRPLDQRAVAIDHRDIDRIELSENRAGGRDRDEIVLDAALTLPDVPITSPSAARRWQARATSVRCGLEPHPLARKRNFAGL